MILYKTICEWSYLSKLISEASWNLDQDIPIFFCVNYHQIITISLSPQTKYSKSHKFDYENHNTWSTSLYKNLKHK